MALYLKQELYGQGVLGEVLTGNKNFRFQNDGDYSIYFTLAFVYFVLVNIVHLIRLRTEYSYC